MATTAAPIDSALMASVIIFFLFHPLCPDFPRGVNIILTRRDVTLIYLAPQLTNCDLYSRGRLDPEVVPREYSDNNAYFLDLSYNLQNMNT